MTRSRTILSAILVFFAAEAAIRVHAQDAPAKPINDPVKMRWLLNEWERRTDRLDTLEVRIYRIDKDREWNVETHYEGVATFKAPNLASIDFWKLRLLPDGKGHLVPVKGPKDESSSPKSHVERLVRVEDAIWQYIDDGRQIHVFPRAKGEKQDILDVGPYPFLFKLNANEAEARYRWSIAGENADYYLVKVFPRHKEDRSSFKIALLCLQKELMLPARIILFSPDSTGTREYRLDRQRPNAPVDNQIFRGGVIPGWTVQKNLFDLLNLRKAVSRAID
jgi:hypothetical protein